MARSLSLFAVSVLLGFAPAALAEYINQADMERCAQKQDAVLRLACYDELTSKGRGRPDRSRPALTIEVPNSPTRVEINRSTSSRSVNETTVTHTTRDTITTTVPAAVTPVEPEASTAAVDVEVAGQEQVSTKTRKPEPQKNTYDARVTRVEKSNLGNLYFYMEDGQVWQQAEARYFPYPGEGVFDVVISRAMFGGYRLQIGGDGRMERIRRVK